MSDSQSHHPSTDERTRPTASSPVHTPGPWEIYRNDGREEYDIGHKRGMKVGLRHVATVPYGYDEPAETEQHANARLIAAAPDLLAIARDISTMDCFYAIPTCPDGCDCVAARAARAVDHAEGRGHG